MDPRVKPEDDGGGGLRASLGETTARFSHAPSSSASEPRIHSVGAIAVARRRRTGPILKRWAHMISGTEWILGSSPRMTEQQATAPRTRQVGLRANKRAPSSSASEPRMTVRGATAPKNLSPTLSPPPYSPHRFREGPGSEPTIRRGRRRPGWRCRGASPGDDPSSRGGTKARGVACAGRFAAPFRPRAHAACGSGSCRRHGHGDAAGGTGPADRLKRPPSRAFPPQARRTGGRKIA